MILFLDFDGVLHPEIAQRPIDLLNRLPLVEEVMREFPGVEIVISSAWRLKYANPIEALVELRKHFSPDIASRVVGVTPDHTKMDDHDSPEGLSRFTRHWECEAWMRANRLPGTRWMAMDDRVYMFRPFTEHLMAFDRLVAFTQDHQDSLRAYLVALTSGTPWPPYNSSR